MRVFDANVGLGRFSTRTVPCFSTAGDLLVYMDHLGIGDALVYSVLARECGPELGNDWLVAETAAHPRLHPCLTLVPGDSSLVATFDRMRTENISCGRIFPRAGHFSVRPWCMDAVAEGLLALPHGVLFVDFELDGWDDEAIDWEGLRDLCLHYPDLPVVVAGVTTIAPRLYDHLMAECPNLHLEISHLCVPGELERLCARGWSRRILFGSDGPLEFAGGLLSQIRCARLKEAHRRAILAANLQCLMGSATREPAVTMPASPAMTPAIDMHVHHGRWHHSVCGPGDADGIIGEMDRCGIAKAVLTSIFSCYGGVTMGNEAVADACRRYPTRLFGYITVDPKLPEEMERELHRHGAEPAFRGLKFHCAGHGVNMGSGLYAAALDYADRRGWPVLIHGADPVDTWLEQCRRYPHAKLIIAHASGFSPAREEDRRFVQGPRDHANLFLDLAAGSIPPGGLEWLVETAGADHVVYGSDYPLSDFGYERGRVDYSPLPQAEKSQILFENAERLLNIQAHEPEGEQER